MPLIEKIEKIPVPPEKRTVEFKVYSKDRGTHSMILLGSIIERRIKERRNNLRDRLVKAEKDYSDCVADPSTIFLLGS